jgi:hypothetical protein
MKKDKDLKRDNYIKSKPIESKLTFFEEKNLHNLTKDKSNIFFINKKKVYVQDKLNKRIIFQDKRNKGYKQTFNKKIECAAFMFPSAFLIQFVSSMYKRLEPHLASSHDNHKREINGA